MTAPSRVLFIVENNSVPFDTRVWNEAEAIRDAGHQVSVICPRTSRSQKRRETIAGIRIWRHPRPIEADRPWEYLVEYANAIFWQLALTIRILVTSGVDVVHIANPPDLAFVAGGLLRLVGASVVFDQHDLSPEIYEAKFGHRGWVWRLLLFCEWASYRVADVVITSNESMKQTAIERGGRRPEAIYVVRNGPRRIREANATPAKDLRNGRRHLVCYMGIIAAQEGLEGLIRIADDIVHQRGRDDVQFLIIGDGTGLNRLKQEAREHGLEEHVTFTGYLTGNEFWEALAAADVCVSPEPRTPLNDRSTLIKTMEYMALGKPVVQYDMTEARVTAGDTALYAEPDNEKDLADKIVLLLDDPDLRARLGSKANQRVREKLAWQHQVPALIAAYSRLNGHRHA